MSHTDLPADHAARHPSEAPTREGYVFVEWSGSSYQPGEQYTVSDNHTFTAVWETEVAEEEDEDEDTPDKPKKPVDTGDDTSIYIPIAFMCVSMAGIITLLLMRRRKEM